MKQSGVASKEKKSAPAKTSTEKARLILDQAYQLALNAKPAARAEALAEIADALAQVDKPRAAVIYRTAFEATQDMPIEEEQKNGRIEVRAQIQSYLAVGLADIDPEAAMELANRVDPPLYTDESMSVFRRGGGNNYRARAIQQVVMKLADKDLSKAMILILPTLKDNEFPYSAILPLAGRLKKEAPDKAELLFSELLRHFAASPPTVSEVLAFPTVIRAFADLNRNLALQAVDTTLQKIPQMEEAVKKETEKHPARPGQPSPDFGALTKSLLLPTLRMLDPQRAAALEKEVQPYVEKRDKETGGMFSAARMNPEVDPTSSGQRQQEKMLEKADLDKMPEAQRDRFSISTALSLAQSNPAKAQDVSKYITEDRNRAWALAAIAGGFAASDKEKARSVLSEAASLAEKVKVKEDRAVLFAMLGEGAVRIDRELAKRYYLTSFENFDQTLEELKQPAATEKEQTANEEKIEQLSQRYSMAVADYSNVDFDGAVERARQIKNEEEKLPTLIRLATRVLAPNSRIPRIQFLGKDPRLP